MGVRRRLYVISPDSEVINMGSDFLLLKLGGGVLSDCWRAEERGKAIAIYSLAPFIGPAVGPIGEYPRTYTSNTTDRR